MANPNPKVAGGAAAGAVLTLMVVGVFVSDLWIGTYLANFLQGQFYWLAPMALIGVAALLASSALRTRTRRPRRRGQTTAAESSNGSTLTFVAAALLTMLGTAGLTWAIFVSGYVADQKYLGRTDDTTDAQPTFKERPAYDVANAQAPGAQGTFRGEIIRTAYIADKGVFGSLIRKSGAGSSRYVGVMEQDMELTGQSEVSVCEFSESADKRLGGYFSHSMARALSHLERGLIINEDDAYGYCDDTTPMVVIPLQELEGLLPAVKVPAGVAIYNGETGALALHESMDDDEVPGPVYPMSLAARQREALNSFEASWWQSLRGQAGYSDTSSDKGDPNASNRSELTLAKVDGADTYTSPLTLRGRNSAAIAAVGVVEAGAVKAGDLNTMVVHELKEARKANSAVDDRIRTDYADLPGWQNGMKIYEIAPVSPGVWVASFGQKQNVAYRVRINADASSCLETADGRKIRCGASTQGEFTSTIPGTPGTPSADPVPLPETAAELAKLSPAQLKALHEQITDEMIRRIEASGPTQ